VERLQESECNVARFFTCPEMTRKPQPSRGIQSRKAVRPGRAVDDVILG